MLFRVPIIPSLYAPVEGALPFPFPFPFPSELDAACACAGARVAIAVTVNAGSIGLVVMGMIGK